MRGKKSKKGTMTKTALWIVILFLFSSSAAFALDPIPAMGQGLFEQQGSNSCMFCHGIDGKKGNVAAAANLSQPKTWRGWKGVGGDASYSKDPKTFVANLKKHVVDLVKNGAIRHNANYKDPSFNWKAAGPFNSQMVGLGGAASQQWLKRMAERGVTDEIAAQSLWLHISQKLDQQGVLNK
jgi:hypothetical protein